MTIDAFEQALILDDRAGFYMVPSASIAKARARLSGAHLTEALAGLVCLARESYAQHGASREDLQDCEANLDALATRILGVSRERALRIVDNLVDAGALTKQAHRFDTSRGRLPSQITFVDRAVSFAYVSGSAFRALARAQDEGRPAFGPLALYLALVALGGEQRDEFPNGNRRMARASQPELARLSGLSVSSVKRALDTLTACELLVVRAQAPAALKTKAIYRLVDPTEHGDLAAPITVLDARAAARTTTVHSPTDDSPQPDRRQLTARPTTAHSPTDDGPQPDRPSAHSPTDDSSPDCPSSAHSRTDRPSIDPARAHVELQQMTDPQIKISSLSTGAPETGGEGREIDRLLEAFCSWTRQALGERRFTALYDAAQWRHAAAQLLEQYDLDRILAGVDRLSRDALLADKATTLPAFEQIAERAIARAAADRRLALHRDSAPSASPDSAAGRMSWAAAHDMLRQAVGAFGGAGEQRALAHLQAQDARLAAFVRDVGWRAVARSDAAMNDVKFAYLQYRPADDREVAR